MTYCVHKKHAMYKNEKENWVESCQKFLKQKDNWKYKFENEYSKKDCEQSLLSQLIFIKLFCRDKNIDSAEMLSDGISISVEKKQIEKDFLFDVMNNPNKGHQPYIQANYLNKDYGKMSFEEIYHTIGNFAPVPRSIVSRHYGPNLQLIHKDLNELWPWFLKFLKDNWNDFPTKVYELMSFNEYIHISCQQMYFSKVFDKMYDMKKRNEDWDSILGELSEIEISKDDRILSFDKLFDENNISEVDERIKFLIELRGRYILFILNKE